MRRLLLFLALLGAGCASAPPPAPPVVTWEQKLGWMMRLEDQRILRDLSAPPPAVIAPATRTRPAIVAPAPPSDLIKLLADGEARVRRRAALAVGRVGLADGVAPLAKLLADADTEVRQMAAFGLGLIGDAPAREALLAALKDAEPIVQGRAAEALGLIGNTADAAAVSAMVQAHVKAGALASVAADEIGHPLAPPVEAARLGLYALARLGSYDALAAAVLDASGRPVSRWWPVPYAVQRLGDAKGAPVLLALLDTPGRYTAAFAARGLGGMKAAAAAGPLRRIVSDRRAHAAVVIQAIRALGAIGDTGAASTLAPLAADTKLDTAFRLEAIAALGAIRALEATDLLVDLMSDPAPPLRGAAMRALAQADPDTFATVLSGQDPDRDWTVRVAQAQALGSLPGDTAGPGLLAMLRDGDQRVIPAVLLALAAARVPDAEPRLVQHLGHDDFVIRGTAANALAELKAAGAAQALVNAYRRGLNDPTYVARAAALAALVRVAPDAARPLVVEAAGDRDWAMRVRAAQLLKEIGGAELPDIRPAVAERPMDEGEWGSLIAPAFSPHAFIETDRGTIEIELAILDAPLTVANFMGLARRGFFNGVAIHRVVPDFVVQDGDPRGDGEGGPGYTIRDEINQRPYLRGTVGMALDWEDTGGSQFFITHSPQPHLDARFTVFGHVVDGMDAVDRIQPWDVIRRVRIWDGVTMTP